MSVLDLQQDTGLYKSTRSLGDFFGSNLFERFAWGRFALLAFLLFCVGGASASGSVDFDKVVDENNDALGLASNDGGGQRAQR